MDTAKYWVIGSEFTGTDFSQVVDGTQCVHGPFASYDDARHTWRERANATRASCHVRYTIVEEASRL